MELKQEQLHLESQIEEPLIVPYGIETGCNGWLCDYLERPLIVPYGIETLCRVAGSRHLY